MSNFKKYYMWWSQSQTEQGFWYTPWKKTTHIFKGRTQKEATNKMNKFLNYAEIKGRFLCLEDGLEATHE